MPCQPGDRIRLINMPFDPDPIEPGSEGTVISVNEMSFGRDQISVDWDHKRSLMLIEGIDEYEVIGHVLDELAELEQ